jgi:hypothetical protein
MTTHYVFFIEWDGGIHHLSVHASPGEAETALSTYVGKLFSDAGEPVPADADLVTTLVDDFDTYRVVDCRIFVCSADGDCDWYVPPQQHEQAEQQQLTRAELARQAIERIVSNVLDADNPAPTN